MSASLYRWTEKCDEDYCPGDCDYCDREGNEMSREEVQNDLQIPWKDERQRDLVKVCRCRDCKWARKHTLFENQSYGFEYWQCERSELGEYQIIELDDFCSRGERRDDKRV